MPDFPLDRTALAAIDGTTQPAAYLAEGGREGLFVWNPADLSAKVSADGAQGVYVAPTGGDGSTGAWVRQTGDSLNVKWFGAAGDGTTDDWSAFYHAHLMMDDWGTLEIPAGTYALSQTWVWQKAHRSHLICRGVFIPHSSLDDDTGFLVSIESGSPDSLIPSMGVSTVVDQLSVDCQWKCRGVRIDGIYNSTLNSLRVWRPYGTGIRVARAQECTMIHPVIFAGKPRVVEPEGVFDWDPNTDPPTRSRESRREHSTSLPGMVAWNVCGRNDPDAGRTLVAFNRGQ